MQAEMGVKFIDKKKKSMWGGELAKTRRETKIDMMEPIALYAVFEILKKLLRKQIFSSGGQERGFRVGDI